MPIEVFKFMIPPFYGQPIEPLAETIKLDISILTTSLLESRTSKQKRFFYKRALTLTSLPDLLMKFILMPLIISLRLLTFCDDVSSKCKKVKMNNATTVKLK